MQQEVQISVDSIVWGLAVGSATYVKIVIDLFRATMVMPSWLPPLAAVLLGIGFVLLGQVAIGASIDGKQIALAILAGTVAGSLAVTQTVLARRGDAKQQTGQ